VRRPRRTPILALLGVSAAAAVSLPIYALAAAGDDQYPDLRADPPENVSGPEFYSTASGIGAGRLLVRFDGFVTNVGKGPLEISGNPQVSGAAGVHQLARTVPGTNPSVVKGTPEVIYETADGHNHFHLKRVMRYSLWNSTKTAQVSPGQKVGFCLYDLQDAPSPSPAQDPQIYVEAVTHFCDKGVPGSTSLRMGVSVGWRDVYDKSLSYQWVDVSDTPPGIYYVAADADPDNVIWEGGGAAEAPSRAFAAGSVTIPGWVAQPISGSQNGSPQTIALKTVKFGGQGNSNLRYRIVAPPGHGTLNVATGPTFSAGSVTYTPAAGYSGGDSFSYAAIFNTNGYPLNPPTATVSLAGTAPSLSISGAPASLVAGTSAQLTANLANLSGGVNWSVSAGSVSPAGLYVAPSVPPAGGVATVTATSAPNPVVSASVAIAIAPSPKPVPLPGVTGNLSAGAKLLSPLKVRKVSRRVLVATVVTGATPGTVKITATFGRKVLGRCAARAPARRALTCKIRLKRSYPLLKVRMTAKFTGGGKTAVRRSFVVR
jgi:hypothetical protein